MTTADSSPFSKLSPELALSVLEQLEWDPDAKQSTLLNCMLCSKDLYALASRILYREVVLTHETLSGFVSRRNTGSIAVANRLLQRLTIRLDPTKTNRHDAAGYLEDLGVRHIPLMNNLKCLSVYQIPVRSVSGVDFGVPTEGLAEILRNLPTSCTSLELQSIEIGNSSSQAGVNSQGSGNSGTHLCPLLRQVLPRLEYLRIRLPSLCPEVLKQPDASVNSQSPSIVELPHLKECILNMARKWGPLRGPAGPENSPLCSDPDQPGFPSLARALRRLVHENKAPAAERIWALEFQPHLDEPRNPNKYAAFVVRDVLRQASIALPHRDVHALQRDTWHLRRPVPGSRTTRADGGVEWQWEDVVGWSYDIEQLAEGPSWQDVAASTTVRGLRIPKSLIQSSEGRRFEVINLPVLSAEQFYVQRRINSILWANEKKVGRFLLIPAEKDLMAEHADLDMVIPKGWRQPDDAPFLVKIETTTAEK